VLVIELNEMVWANGMIKRVVFGEFVGMNDTPLKLTRKCREEWHCFTGIFTEVKIMLLMNVSVVNYRRD